ncbi:MAG: N-acetylmuramoyl-L-alanine amidase [Bacteroidales bacterium]|jgi:N-acetylmuramoyl-L-alanine amidase|nr:N-acetylmuramoyl-L-alanine amidase [Bacteroidales bacterium]
MKNGRLKLILLLILALQGASLYAQDYSGQIKTVTLDAGHGGHDPGAIGAKSKEKDIVLDVVLRTGALIKQHYPDVKVIYTRDKDVFVKLYDRANIANINKTDLFISVHCNAAKHKAVYGAETFVMGLEKTESNLEVAKKENASILLEANYTENYNGFDPNNDEDYIAMTMFQSASFDQSLKLADKVQKQLIGPECKRYDRGVRQGPFLVLHKVAMPSILVELGFISNVAEENYLRSEAGKKACANALFNAFKEYKTEKEASLSSAVQTAEIEKVEPPIFYVQIAASANKMNIKSFKNVDSIEEKYVNGNYVYLTGKSTTLTQAKNKLPTIKNKGYKDAFVVAFIGNRRISAREAEALQ